NNENGQMGDGTYTEKYVPTQVLMEGGGAYIDMSSVRLNGDSKLPKYSAKLVLNDKAKTGTGILFVGTAADATAVLDATAGETVTVRVTPGVNTKVAGGVLVVEGGAAKSLSFSGNETTFVMPNGAVTVLVSMVNDKGEDAMTYRISAPNDPSVRNGFIKVYAKGTDSAVDYTTLDALPGTDIYINVTPGTDYALSALYLIDKNGVTSPVAYDSVAGKYHFVLPDGNVALDPFFAKAATLPATYPGKAVLRDVYNKSGAVNTFSVAVNGVQVGNQFTAAKGSTITVTATTNMPTSFFAMVTVKSSTYRNVTVPVYNQNGVATFTMPADEAEITVSFQYGSTSKMGYNTMTAPDGSLMTALIYNDQLQIILEDMMAYVGFNAYGPLEYTPDPETLTFYSTSPEVATISNDPVTRGLITAKERAGTTYIVVLDDRGNTGFFKLGVIPAPDTTQRRDVTFPMIATGNYHTVALKANGTVWAWGSNLKGQLGVRKD
ncbi:MAG: RCC1 domain-containing protein, partial [Oscillospiraceae bacterium]